jgi:hypothetical protein
MLTLAFLLVFGEVFHLLFSNIPFAENEPLSSPMYFLINQFGLINFVPSIFIFKLTPNNKKSSKCIGAGIILWNFKELLEEIFYIFKLDYNFFDPLNVNSSLYGQIVFITAIILLGYYGYKKWKY